MTDRNGCQECAELRRRIAAIASRSAHPDAQRVIAEELFDRAFGGMSDPDMIALARSITRDDANFLLAALACAGFEVVKRGHP